MTTSFLSGLLLLALGQGDAKTYARPTLLMEPTELAKPEIAKTFRILDTRSAKDFVDEHIPLSSRVTAADWSKTFAMGPGRKFFETELGRHGIDIDVPVVVYGDDLREVARIWWILRYWGVKDVSILNGGWAAWKAGGYRVAKKDDKEPAIAPKTPMLTPAEKRLATMEQLKDSLKDKRFQIVDARSEGEFCGDVKLAKRGGAIPGAIHLEWKDVLDPKTQRFKSAGELVQVFKKAGIDLSKPAVAHCQSGGRSSVMVFAMELMGANDVRNYYRSWAEWGNAADTPVVLPK
jgi:thiosulfate/3-mercaptopyruvate sulfurtransferase